MISESPFIFISATQFLDSIIQEEKRITRDFSEATFTDSYLESMRKQQYAIHLDLLQKYQQAFRFSTIYI